VDRASGSGPEGRGFESLRARFSTADERSVNQLTIPEIERREQYSKQAEQEAGESPFAARLLIVAAGSPTKIPKPGVLTALIAVVILSY